MKTLSQMIKAILLQFIQKQKFEVNSLFQKEQIVQQIIETIDQIQLYLSGGMGMHEIMMVVTGISDNNIQGNYEYDPQYFLEIKQKIKIQAKSIIKPNGVKFAMKLIR